MSHNDHALTIARERIAEEARTRTGFLDLGRLGLDELPAELLALTHLRRLNLGDGYVDDEGEWVRAISEIAPNRLDSQLHRLAVLPCLGALSVTGAQLTTLAGVTQLRTLQSLDCSETQVTDLSPLSELSALQSLDCSETWVTDLSPVSGLSALQSLDCSETQVTDLSPVSGLSALQSLNCSETQVTDLSPLSGLSALQSLNCSQCTLSTIPGDLWHKPSLRYLCLFETQMPGIRTEVLSQNNYMSCLESLRAHLSDLRAGAAAVPDVKLMVLGNGRVGKTQICRRLRGESYDPRVPSTHGVVVTSAPLPTSDGMQPALLHIWDFGGQDIYHGTHALFMRTRAAFLIAWAPEAESSGEHVYEGMLFRNHPLPYWLDTVRHLGAAGSPVLIVQTRCDRLEDAIYRLPAPPELLAALPHWELQYSAINNRKRAALDEALREAVERIRGQEGEVTIGTGRLQVKQRLEQLRDADAAVPPDQRQYRTIRQEHFLQLCEEAGGIGAPEYLLSYLHNAGIVFYRPGLFDDRIILDQAWALEAIYAVFNRESCYRPLRHLRDRFTRAILEALAWRDYNAAEQEVFLGMMRSCGICFVHRRRTGDRDEYEEYIAPDLLPERTEIQAELDAMWDEQAPVEASEFEYALLHPGMVRSVISRIGSEAGVTALYWRGGLCVYETTTRSRALIEREMTNEWRGKILIRTQLGQAAELLRRLSALVRDESARMGAVRVNAPPADISLRPAELSPARDERNRTDPPPPLQFGQEHGSEPQYFVSYAWGDESPKGRQSEAIVDQLCEAAEQRGLVILRDKKVLGLGDSISKFMQRLAGGNRVFVVLSDKYLRSPYCMYELLEIWRKCSGEEEKFLDRVRVYIIPDTKIFSVTDRAQYAIYWRQEYEKVDQLIHDHGPDVVGRRGFQEYKLMGDFRRWVAEILETVADRLQPRDFEDLAKYGLDDLIPGSAGPR